MHGILDESAKSGIERGSQESAVIEEGYREDFMQKTFEKKMML